ncbi:hypothetical protein K470DRAFT_264369 [Piedraia hortae CBS 480.64]|uniref:BTB domain-containing protein n=1 Tax=Piedraia hortae CBS 480.64 TaxID=1314780 RepID=A0A6A7C012_9PEZI|nr:hypothetical protein K470DRAFT_264369 [Piedraia hortae CBS 480.64]
MENKTGSARVCDYLYSHGFLEGRYSDITVNAFGTEYKLHRLSLEQAPFFAAALSTRWLDPSTNEIFIHPEEVDASISKIGFDLALKLLYGCDVAEEKNYYAIKLLATGLWLEMQDLIDDTILNILGLMESRAFSKVIQLVTNKCYGRAGYRNLASIEATLCCDEWEMKLKH